jgi:glycosyltransferase involved in cell wall biosynthesis
MNILWLTPFNFRSAIGVFSREVCSELLKRGHQVRIMRTESGPQAHWRLHATDITVMGPDDPIPSDVDITVINFGNHAPYHAGTLRVAATNPSVAIFHDAETRDFEWGMIDRHGLALPHLLNDAASDRESGKSTDLVDPGARPILEMLSAISVAAIVHGPHYEATVAAACAGPVRLLPLCFPNTGDIRKGQHLSSRKKATIFGIISPYKQPGRLLRAASQLKQEGTLTDIHFAGPIEEHFRVELIELARDLGIGEPTFHGYMEDDDLITLLGSSDAICCLRYPVTEGGSASLITAMYQGRPVIVSDVASYSMVPDEFIWKVSYGEDHEDLAKALRQTFEHPKAALEAAAKGRDWAELTYSARTYVNCLEPLLEEAMSNLPIFRAMRNMAAEAIAPNGEPMSAALVSMARAMKDLFSSD